MKNFRRPIIALLFVASVPACGAVEGPEADDGDQSSDEVGSVSTFQTLPATISGLTPRPNACLLRNSTILAERTLTLTGSGFPYPRQTENLQFRREDTRAGSIHFGLEVVWTSSTQISVDIARIAHLLWQDPKVTLQVRITTYDPAYPQGQRPISEWSNAQVVLATDAATCNFVNNTTSRPTLTYYPLRDYTQAISPGNMDLFQYAMYNIGKYTSTEGRHPGMDFLDVMTPGSFRTGLQVAAAGDGTLVGYYDPAVSPASPAGQPAWVANASPTDVQYGRAYVVVAHRNMVAVYAHLSSNLWVRRAVGARIHGGEVLGSVGMNVDGDHLHLETRTYGQNGYNISNPPLIFVNAYEYFNSAIRSWINVNIVNRYNMDQQAVRGWNGAFDAGTQRTQCFTVSGTQLKVYGYDANGQHVSSVEDNSLTTGPSVVSGPTPLYPSTWQAVCVP